MKKTKLSIIIVYYSGKRDLFDCLKSISRNSPDISYEVIVVNNSADESIKDRVNRYKNCKYIKSPGNIGYGAGNNYGVKNSSGEYVLILNPDTKVKKGSIDVLFDTLTSDKKIGIAAPNLFHSDGKMFDQLGSRKLTPMRGIVALSFLNKLFPKNPISQKYWLHDLDMNKKREVDVVPGACFILKKSEFFKTGMFDEQFFLYFEESDFCKRYKEKIGKKIVITPHSKVIHHWEAVKSDLKHQKIFEKSRKYYFQKHYGIFWSLVVEIFARFSKYLAGLSLIVIWAFFLRFYQFQDRISFHSEIGFEYLEIKNYLENGLLPLHGPPTSHEWLTFGPYYYYLMFPIFLFTNSHPLSGAYFFRILGALLPIFCYMAFRKVFDRKFSTLAAFLITTSPLFITLSLSARFFSLLPLFSLPFLIFVFKKRLTKKDFFWLFFILSFLINIHYSAGILVFIPIYRLLKNINRKTVLFSVFGFVLPFLPLVIYSFKTGSYSIFKFFAWIGYRFTKGVTDFTYLSDTLSFFLSFFAKISDFLSQILLKSNEFFVLVFFLLLFFTIVRIEFTNQKFRQKIYPVFLILFIGFGALFIQKDIGEHYLVPVYLPLILIYSYIFYMGLIYFKKATLVLLCFLFINSLYFCLTFQKDEKEPSYNLQVQVAKAIKKDAQGKSFSIARKGQFDYYEGNFADNYRYLLCWIGDKSQKDTETIYIIDETNTLEGDKIFVNESLSVIRK